MAIYISNDGEERVIYYIPHESIRWAEMVHKLICKRNWLGPARKAELDRRDKVLRPGPPFGECCGGSSGGGDIDGVGSWGRHVRQWEDRDDPLH